MRKTQFYSQIPLILISLFGLFFAVTEINGCNGGITVAILRIQKVIEVDDAEIKKQYPQWSTSRSDSEIAHYVAAPYIRALVFVSIVSLTTAIIHFWGSPDDH
ncbi:MAG: hypothetical protein K8U03_27135 [Planctomycetia bacterium]|nr:hypothetical protein [Planctomycetia bacterium]